MNDEAQAVDPRPRIRPDVKQWWTQRLTDGTYEQLQGQLSMYWMDEGGGHAEWACCLGVLTGAAIEHGCPNIRWSPKRDGSVQWFDEEDWNSAQADVKAGRWPDDTPPVMEDYWREYEDGDLPRAVAMWAFDLRANARPDSDYSNPVLVVRDEELRAISLNDDMNYTFDEIAALVEDLPEADLPAVTTT
jgi:hypothetical protein